MLRLFAKLSLFFCLAVFARDDGQLLSRGSEALGKRIGEIRSAKKEILISSFILRDHASARLIAAELIRARARGVQVKVLIDQAGVLTAGSRKVLSILNAQGVEVKVYNPLKRFWKLNVRNHGKLFVVDGQSFILGGRNLWDESFSLGRKSHDDLEVYVKGDSAKQVRDYFFKLWRSPGAADFKKKSEGTFDTVHELTQLFQLKGFDSIGFKRGYKGNSPLSPIGKIELLGDGAGKGDRQHQRLFNEIEGAKSKVKIETPWIIPTKSFRQLVERTRDKFIELKVLTNSPQTSEKPFRAFLSRAQSLDLSLLRPWVVFEKVTGRSLHSKYTLIDGLKAYIGSFNFSPRSEWRNLEAGVLIENSPLVNQLEDLFLRRSSIARPMPPESRMARPCSTILSFLARPFY